MLSDTGRVQLIRNIFQQTKRCKNASRKKSGLFLNPAFINSLLCVERIWIYCLDQQLQRIEEVKYVEGDKDIHQKL